jgi:hypothetical protein
MGSGGVAGQMGGVITALSDLPEPRHFNLLNRFDCPLGRAE